MWLWKRFNYLYTSCDYFFFLYLEGCQNNTTAFNSSLIFFVFFVVFCSFYILICWEDWELCFSSLERASNLVNAKMTITNEKFDISLRNKESRRYQNLSKQVIVAVRFLVYWHAKEWHILKILKRLQIRVDKLFSFFFRLKISLEMITATTALKSYVSSGWLLAFSKIPKI